MSQRWLRLILGLVLAGCAHQKKSVKNTSDVHACPKQSMPMDKVVDLYNAGVETTKKGMRGEYHLMTSLEKGLEMLEVAALHGHLPAMKKYSGHFIHIGIVELMPLLDYSAKDAAEEGMLWLILRKHLGEKISEGDEETFRILLDPTIPFPTGFFRQSAGTAWLLQMLTPDGLQRSRKQAYAWRNCWRK
jgi:hypothetical protein